MAALAAASVLAAAPAAVAADVTLVGPEGRVALSEAAQGKLTDIVKRETESCSISSTAYPDAKTLEHSCGLLPQIRRRPS
jgi:hypothetical protein